VSEVGKESLALVGNTGNRSGHSDRLRQGRVRQLRWD
jgi:hypothetical protein